MIGICVIAEDQSDVGLAADRPGEPSRGATDLVDGNLIAFRGETDEDFDRAIFGRKYQGLSDLAFESGCVCESFAIR